MRRGRVVLAVAIGLVAVWIAAIPPVADPLPAPPGGLAPPVRGAIHIHTRRSDGGGTIESIARAAARAGLRFVVITDHGDGTRPLESATYYSDVLAIDAVEISTDNGHLLALGMPRAPYPLGGESRDVIEDVIRLGGFAVAAHPDSAKAELRWSDWNEPFDGFEWLNGDSEWRDESALTLGRVLLAYPIRPSNALGLLLDRSERSLRHWEALTRQRRVVAFAGADAHARLGLHGEDPANARVIVPLPGYEAVFRTFSVALPQLTLSRDAAEDAANVIAELRAGHVFTSIDALGFQPAFSFAGTSGGATAVGGDVLEAKTPIQFAVRVQAPAAAQIALLRDGAPLVTASGGSLQHSTEPGPAVYRVEVSLPGAPGQSPVPWIVSNPIYVGRTTASSVAPAQRQEPATSTSVYADGPANGWTVEHSSASQAALDVRDAVTGTQLHFRYAVGGGESTHPFAALVAPAGSSIAAHDRLTFSARADRPMRLSVQVRAPGSTPDGERWHRSVYLDELPREITVFFADMRPSGTTRTPRPVLSEIQSLLFVVDTVNTATGTAGQVVFDNVRYERPAPSGANRQQ